MRKLTSYIRINGTESYFHTPSSFMQSIFFNKVVITIVEAEEYVVLLINQQANKINDRRLKTKISKQNGTKK